MNDIIDKLFNLGFGIANYSREKVEEFVEELVKKGEVAKKDAADMAKEIIKRGKEEKDKIEAMVEENITRQLEKFDYVKKDDIRKVVKEEIEKYIGQKGEEK